jgi:UDP:flavonoid glycosyltransferase YjiC (YdhE family)
MKLLIPLFSPATGTWGGLTRVLAIADAAKSAGHSVAFCASGSLEKSLVQHGYLVYSMPEPTMFGLPKPISRIIEKRSQRASIPVKPGKAVGSIWLVLALSGMANSDYLERLVKAERQAVSDFGAEMLFTDLDPGAFMLASIMRLPIASNYASIITTGIGNFFWKAMERAVNSVLKTYSIRHMDPHELCFSENILKIIPSIPELDDTDPGRPDVRYVGHLLGDIQTGQTFQPEPGKRYIFVYSGTGSVSLSKLEEVLPRVFPADGPYICLVGAQSVQKPYRLGGVEFRPYVPAEEVLAYCDWTICHGGQNTIIQSLRRGVPLIIFPGPIFERRYNAQKVQDAGAGVMGELDQFTTEWLQQVLLCQAEYAIGAKKLRDKIKALGGPTTAVKAIGTWFHQKGCQNDN